MGKNVNGGSSHKKFARKFSSGGNTNNNNKLRISENDGEIYSIVTKLLGNNMFHCYSIDGVTRLGHIRGKFTGRGKRDNMLECGKWVLIGLREWDIPSETKSNLSKGKPKMQQCDVLEVYSDMDKQRLRESVSENWTALDSNDVSKTTLGEVECDDILFGTDKDFERDRLIEEMKSTTVEKISLEKDADEEDDEINVDDI